MVSQMYGGMAGSSSGLPAIIGGANAPQSSPALRRCRRLPRRGGGFLPTLVCLVGVAIATVAAARQPKNPSSADVALERDISQMTPNEKIGQLLLVGCDAPVIDRDLRTMLEQWRVGGVILYQQNLSTPDQIRALTTAIRAAARGPVPPIIATDEEGGFVHRVPTDFPGSMALGATGSTALAREAGAEIGLSLRDLGITMNLAPVLDVDRDPESAIGSRSFGDRSAFVGAMGVAFIEGQTASRVISVAKHFVGEGSAKGDTHSSAPSVEVSAKEIRDEDLIPFRMAIARGVPVIMTSHVAVPALTAEGDLPITLSSSVVTGLLRGELAYDGVIMTDAFEMTAIRQRKPLGELAVEAFEAGADILLTVGGAQQRWAIRNALIAAYASGRIDEARIDASVRRILKLKKTFDVGAGGVKHAQRDVMERVADRSITLVSACPGSMASTAAAIRRHDIAVVAPRDFVLRGDLPNVISLKRKPSASEAADALRGAGNLGDGEFVIAAFENGAQADVIRQIAELRPMNPVIVVSMGNPRDLERIPGAAAYLAIYSDSRRSVSGLLAVLTGRKRPVGLLPVALRTKALISRCDSSINVTRAAKPGQTLDNAIRPASDSPK